MRIGYLECFSGISGDMLLGALVDAGVSFACLAETAAALNVGARLEMRKVNRGGLAAIKVDVITPDTLAVEPGHSHQDHPKHVHHEHEPHAHTAHAPHRSLSAILEIIRSAPLSEAVKQRSIRAFQLLGEAEAAIHSVPIEEVHFHEVGAVDTIVDIVCAAAGAEALGEKWVWTAGFRRRSTWAAELWFASTAHCRFPHRPRWLCWVMRRSTRRVSRWSA